MRRKLLTLALGFIFLVEFIASNDSVDTTHKNRGHSDRIVQASNTTVIGWRSLRIYVDILNMLGVFRDDSKASNAENIFRATQSAAKYFERLLSVNYSQSFNFNGGMCGESEVQAFDVPYNFVVIANEAPADSGYVTSSRICYYSRIDGRPLMSNLFLSTQKTQFVSEQAGLMSSLLREFVHMLVFNLDTFKSFKIPGTNIARPMQEILKRKELIGTVFDCLILPEVVAWAKSHFACPELDCVPLENLKRLDDPRFYWEQTFFRSEIMAPIIEYPTYLSGLTTSLFSASGLYRVLEKFEQFYPDTYKAGCSYFKRECPEIPGVYCNKPDQAQQRQCDKYLSGPVFCLTETDVFYDRTCKFWKRFYRMCEPSEFCVDMFITYKQVPVCRPWAELRGFPQLPIISVSEVVLPTSYSMPSLGCDQLNEGTQVFLNQQKGIYTKVICPAVRKSGNQLGITSSDRGFATISGYWFCLPGWQGPLCQDRDLDYKSDDPSVGQVVKNKWKRDAERLVSLAVMSGLGLLVLAIH